MKKTARHFIFLLLFLNICISAKAQTDPPYLRFPSLPPFTLETVNGTSLSRENLKKGRATLILYFSPSCDHCISQIQELTENLKAFKPFNILLASYQPMEELVEFEKNTSLKTLPHFYLGRDNNFFFPTFFRMDNLPNISIYNKKRELVVNLQGNQPAETLLKALKEGETL